MPPIASMSDEERRSYLAQMRREANQRFRRLWITTTLIIVSTFVCCTVLILTHNSTQTITLTALGGVALSNLWPMLKKEQNDQIAEYHRSVIESKVDLAATKATEVAEKVSKIEEKTNGNLTKAVHEAAEEVKKAKSEPAPGQEAMPKTKEELETMMHQFATAFCDDMIMQKIEAKLDDAFKAQKQQMKDLGLNI